MTKRLILLTLLLLLPASAWAQLPQMQVYGQDSGTLRAVVVNASGQLSITCANCSGSGASAVDDAAFTVATDSAAPAGFLFDDTLPDSVDEGDVGVGRMSANRNQYVTIRDAAGNERGLAIDANGAIAVTGAGAGTQYTEADTDTTLTGTVVMFESNTGTSAVSAVSNSAPLPVSDAGGALTVDNGGTFAVQAAQSGTWDEVGINDSGNSITVDGTVTVTDGSGALNVICDSGCGSGTQYAEDAAHTSTDQTMFVSGIRRDTTPSSSAGTAGDYTAFNIDANGRLYVQAVLYNSSGSELTLASDATEDSAAGTAGPQIMLRAKDFDGAALPGAVSAEGDAVTLAGSLSGVGYVMLVGEDGSTQYGTSTTPLVVDLGTNNDVTVTGTITANLAAGTNNIGDVDILSIAAGDNNIGNVDIVSGTVTTVSTVTTLSQLGGTAVPVEDAAETAGGTGIYAMAVRRDTAASSAATAGDNATINTDSLGRLWQRDGNPCADHARISSVAINTSTSGNVQLVALNGSDLIYVCGYSVVAGAATGVQFIYGTGTACATGETDITGVWSFAANGGITQANAGVPQFIAPAGNALCVENSGANSIQGHVTYVRTAAP